MRLGRWRALDRRRGGPPPQQRARADLVFRRDVGQRAAACDHLLALCYGL